MSAEYVYEHAPVPRRHGPAFGERPAVPLSEEKEPETRGPLDKRTEVGLGLAIVVPTLAGYAVLAYGCFVAVTATF